MLQASDAILLVVFFILIQTNSTRQEIRYVWKYSCYILHNIKDFYLLCVCKM